MLVRHHAVAIGITYLINSPASFMCLHMALSAAGTKYSWYHISKLEVMRRSSRAYEFREG